MKHLKLHNKIFQDVHKTFYKRLIDEGKSKAHIASTINHTKEFLHFLESKNTTKLNTINQQTLDGYFHYLKHRGNKRRLGGLCDAYLEKHRQAVLRCMEYVLGVDIGQTPFYLPKFEKQRIPKDILTVEEVQQLFNQTDNSMNGIRERAMLSTLYGCGMRKGELHNLNVNDIDMSREVIRIQQTKTRTQRDIPMTQTVRKHLEAYLYGVRELLLPERHQETAFLLNNLGRRMSLQGINHKVQIIAKRSGINKPITAHRLRHAIATHLLGDFTIEEIALFLGHANIDSSQMYTHIKYTNTKHRKNIKAGTKI